MRKQTKNSHFHLKAVVIAVGDSDQQVFLTLHRSILTLVSEDCIQQIQFCISTNKILYFNKYNFVGELEETHEELLFSH